MGMLMIMMMTIINNTLLLNNNNTIPSVSPKKHHGNNNNNNNEKLLSPTKTKTLNITHNLTSPVLMISIKTELWMIIQLKWPACIHKSGLRLDVQNNNNNFSPVRYWQPNSLRTASLYHNGIIGAYKIDCDCEHCFCPPFRLPLSNKCVVCPYPGVNTP